MTFSDDPYTLFSQIKGNASSITGLKGTNATRRDTIVALADHGMQVTTPAPAPTPTPTPTPAPTATVTWGARMDGSVYGRSGDAPWDAVTWDTFEGHAGKRVTSCSFGQPPPWQQAFASGVFELCRARGALPVCDMFATPLADVANGVYDTQIRAWFTAAKAWGGDAVLRLNFEANGTWFACGAEAKASIVNGVSAPYVNSWRRFRSLRDQAGATNIRMVWCVNEVGPTLTPLTAIWPGEAYVDLVGFDAYNWGGTQWRTPEQVYRPTYDALQQLTPSKTIMVNETGCEEAGGSKAGWITAALALIPQLPAISHYSWFNWVASGKNWPIESSATATAAFKAAVANPYYRAGA